MNKRANLLKHVKGASGWRYYPVAWLQNGSVRPNYVLVNGRAEHHQEGFYSIERRDLQQSTAFLSGKKKHDPRTAHNKLAVVAQFLKANNIPGLLKKGDWPSYVEQEPEAYEPEELDKLFAACDVRNRVLFEFFLMTGMRDAEVRHTCWTDVSARQFARVKSKPEWRFTPKNWEEREVPLPDRLMASLREYRQAIGTGSRLLFATPSGQPDRHFLRTLKHIAWTAGLNCGSCKTDKG